MSTEEQLRLQIIEKAWADPAFKKLLLTDAKKALKEAFEIEIPAHIALQALEETENQFYLVIPPKPSTALKHTDSANLGSGW